eukprot:CAMPEP_0179300726 /NCGR_PEP_ID=MMETSP0797-20121207/47187_1 /TAXON_ID=47934 /ORGANISM="Dinophysis acuminata, Strain DAEP01" /LENGTH=151 /DNA_ID=CAMNT_0021010213 /DNA_START=91 /DNA_END=543 /DNA_ORIENTATION=+
MRFGAATPHAAGTMHGGAGAPLVPVRNSTGIASAVRRLRAVSSRLPAANHGQREGLQVGGRENSLREPEEAERAVPEPPLVELVHDPPQLLDAAGHLLPDAALVPVVRQRPQREDRELLPQALAVPEEPRHGLQAAALHNPPPRRVRPVLG